MYALCGVLLVSAPYHPQFNSLVSSVHCGYGKVSCAGQKVVTIYDSTQGTLKKISVSVYLLDLCQCV